MGLEQELWLIGIDANWYSSVMPVGWEGLGVFG